MELLNQSYCFTHIRTARSYIPELSTVTLKVKPLALTYLPPETPALSLTVAPEASVWSSASYLVTSACAATERNNPAASARHKRDIPIYTLLISRKINHPAFISNGFFPCAHLKIKHSAAFEPFLTRFFLHIAQKMFKNFLPCFF